MTTVTLNIRLELDTENVPDWVLKDIFRDSIEPAIADGWMNGGNSLFGYEGPFVTSVTASLNGIEL